MRLQPTRARFVGAALALAGIGALAMDSGDSAARCTVLSAPGGQALVVRVASTAAERSVGLSDMERIPHDGLLLEWSQAGRHPIWMADMRFALDLVWLDTNGTVVAVLTDVPVCAAAPCEVYEPAGAASSRAVLELPAGAAKAMHLVVGERIRYAPATTEACAAE